MWVALLFSISILNAAIQIVNLEFDGSPLDSCTDGSPAKALSNELKFFLPPAEKEFHQEFKEKEFEEELTLSASEVALYSGVSSVSSQLSPMYRFVWRHRRSFSR